MFFQQKTIKCTVENIFRNTFMKALLKCKSKNISLYYNIINYIILVCDCSKLLWPVMGKNYSMKQLDISWNN